jgi:hypothetical protein
MTARASLETNPKSVTARDFPMTSPVGRVFVTGEKISPSSERRTILDLKAIFDLIYLFRDSVVETNDVLDIEDEFSR